MLIVIFILVLIILFLVFLRVLYMMSFGVKAVHENYDRDVPKYEQFEILAGRMLADVDHLLTVPYETVSIMSRDGLKLCGRYYHYDDHSPLVILCHGYHGSAIRDSVGGFRIAKEQGCNILIIHQRAHGESDGRTITMGIKERFDCIDWIRYMLRRLGDDTRICLMGVSMGAATVLMASGLPELPKQVKCVMADCGYSTIRGMIAEVMKMMGYPVKLGYPFVRLASMIYGGFDPDETSPKEALKDCKIPVLLVHGDHDGLVPCEMSYENYEVITSEKELLIVNGANHGVSYFVDQEKYISAAKTFMKKHLY